MPSSLDQAISRIGSVLCDLAAVLDRPDGPGDFLALLGWDLPPGAADIGLSALDLGALVTAVGQLQVKIDIGTTGLELDAAYAQVAVALGGFLQGVDAVVSGFSAAGNYLAATDIADQFVPRLLDYCIVDALRTDLMIALGLLQFTGIVELEPYEADPTRYQVRHLRSVVHWDRVPRLFGDIKGLLSEVYQWGAAGGDPDVTTAALGQLIAGITSEVNIRPLPQRAEAALTAGSGAQAATDPKTQFLLSIVQAPGMDVGVSLAALRPTSAGGTDIGIAFAPYVTGAGDVSFPLTDQITFSVDASLNVDAGIALVFRAGTPPVIRGNLATGGVADVLNGHILATLTLGNADKSPMNLLTVADGLGITVGGVGVGAGVDVNGGRLSALVSAALTGGVLNLSTKNLDSFLASLIPVDVTLDFSLTVGWSSTNGLFVEGNASPHFDISLNANVGPSTSTPCTWRSPSASPTCRWRSASTARPPSARSTSPCSGSASPPTSRSSGATSARSTSSLASSPRPASASRSTRAWPRAADSSRSTRPRAATPGCSTSPSPTSSRSRSSRCSTPSCPTARTATRS